MISQLIVFEEGFQISTFFLNLLNETLYEVWVESFHKVIRLSMIKWLQGTSKLN